MNFSNVSLPLCSREKGKQFNQMYHHKFVIFMKENITAVVTICSGVVKFQTYTHRSKVQLKCCSTNVFMMSLKISDLVNLSVF